MPVRAPSQQPPVRAHVQALALLQQEQAQQEQAQQEQAQQEQAQQEQAQLQQERAQAQAQLQQLPVRAQEQALALLRESLQRLAAAELRQRSLAQSRALLLAAVAPNQTSQRRARLRCRRHECRLGTVYT